MLQEAWISDRARKRIKQIKQSFYHALFQHAKDLSISYYDFLLVAKKQSFRFQQSSHLMSLKNYFNHHHNSLSIKKLTDLLCINQESLTSKDDKILIKFNIPDHDFGPITQANQDQQQYYESPGNEPHLLKQDYNLITTQQNTQQINQKIAIILSIKIQQMQKKLKILCNQFYTPNILTIFNQSNTQQISYNQFRNAILTIITSIRDKIKISQDDIKSIFYLLDQKQKGYLKYQNIMELKHLELISEKMKFFYFSKINKDMVKNTLFKLGKVKNSTIQIYQLKNASLLQFEQLEQQIVNQIIKPPIKKKLPHFGPLKSIKRKKQHHNNNNNKTYTVSDKKFDPSCYSLNTYHNKINYIQKQRQKIQKILKLSKEQKKKQKTWSTISSKLRSLFIHKVILPRQKMLEDQKLKYRKNRYDDYQFTIQPVKDMQ